MWLDTEGELRGEMKNPGRDVSFWLKGPAAAFQPWSEQVKKLLTAQDIYERTGNWEPLQTTMQTDQAEAFIPPTNGSKRDSHELMERAIQGLKKGVVPVGVRYLITTIDTQKNRWVVQVHGIGVDGRIWIVDRYTVWDSGIIGDDAKPVSVSPGTRLEDWRQLEPVIEKEYPLEGGGGTMRAKIVTVDGYGEAGVTQHAYAWYRQLQRSRKDLIGRIYITKGEPKVGATLCELRYPNSQRQDRKANARGEIPVIFVGSTQARDNTSALLDRDVDGPGYVNLPGWAKSWWFDELTAEEKRGKLWVPIRKRNEAWDLLCYTTALNAGPLVQADLIDWEHPPAWADVWERNSNVTIKAIDTAKPSVEISYEKNNSIEDWARNLYSE